MSEATSATRDARWIAESEVCALIDLADAIDVVRAAVRSSATGASWTMEKTHAAWDGGSTLHALGGGLGERGIVGAKTWAHTRDGATPLLLLWDAHDGRLLAVLEAFALGQLRTASMTGVATDALAPPGAAVAALLGTGKQALAQLAALAAVRPLRAVRVWSPTPERRLRFAERARELAIGEIVVAGDVAEATDGADVITTATRARSAFLRSEHVRDGAHVNAIGAITPERRELDAELVARCRPIVADSPAAASALAAELAGVPSVHALADVLAAEPGAAREPGSPSLFKALGIGLADVALGAAVLERALAAGGGRSLPSVRRAAPRLVRGVSR